MSAIVNGLVGGAIAVSLVALADRAQKPARLNPDGWRTLQPGWLLNGTIAACAGFAALMGYILAVVGFWAPDAASQISPLLLLITGFGGAAIYLAWSVYGRTIKWKGNVLLVRALFGGEVARHISDVCLVRKSEALGEYRVTFRDGSALRLSAHLRGAKELVAKMPTKARRT